jgi:hypothetical protein
MTIQGKPGAPIRSDSIPSRVQEFLKSKGKVGASLSEVENAMGITNTQVRDCMNILKKRKKAHSEPVRWKYDEG